MIYISKGLLTNKLELVANENDFEWLTNYIPEVIKTTVDIKAYKKKANNFIAGEMIELKRNDDNLVNKTLICLDYDDIELTASEFKKIICEKLKGVSYYLYATISYTKENPRYRLVIDLDRSVNKKENKNVVNAIGIHIGLQIDLASATYSQLAGLPICTTGNLNTYDRVLSIERPLIVDEWLTEDNKKRDKPQLVEKLKPRSTTAIMNGYIEREQDNLKDYGHWISAITCLAKSVQIGEISQEYAEKYASLLGLENEDWQESSIRKLQAEIMNPNLKTTYTFMSKFSKLNDVTQIMGTYECSQMMLKKYSFVIIGNEENAPLFVYKGNDEGIYTSNYLYIQKLIYAEEQRYTERQVNDVIFKIKMNAPIRKAENNRFLIPVNNGVFNLKTKFTPDKMFLSKVSTNYVHKPLKPKWNFDKWLSEIACFDSQVEELLWQLINETLNGNYTRGKYFILYGSGANAKGTFQQLLINLIGEDNVSNLKLEQIGERFMASNLVGKTTNIGDDINSNYIEDNTLVQSITTGDRIMIEAKGKAAYPVTLKCALVFSANNIPKFRNKTNGTYRRMILIPFLADFSGQKEDKSIKDEKLNQKDVLEYVLNRALNIDFDKYINPNVVRQALEDYKIENDPVLEFYETCWKGIVTSTRIPVFTAYSEYRYFCQNSGYKPTTQIKFSKSLMHIIGKKWSKKRTRLSGYYKEKFYPEPDPSIVHQCFVYEDVT